MLTHTIIKSLCFYRHNLLITVISRPKFVTPLQITAIILYNIAKVQQLFSIHVSFYVLQQLDNHPLHITSQLHKDWKLASVVIYSVKDNHTIWQPGFDLSHCHWSLINHFLTNMDHCTSCCKQNSGLTTTDMTAWNLSRIVLPANASHLKGATIILCHFPCSIV